MEIKFLNDTKKIIAQVKEITGKDIEFKEHTSLKTHAIVKIARQRMPNHIVYYKPVHTDILDHIISHECGHIIRIFKDKGKKIIPYSDSETMNKAISDIDKNFKPAYSDEIKSKVYTMFINGIITQLTNIPEDIRIENWIYENYPELRPCQKTALAKQVNEIVEASKPKIKEITPDIVYSGSGIINYFYIRSLNKLIDQSVLTTFSKTSFFQKAVKFFHEINDIMEEENSLSNSLKVIEYLTKELGFSGWFKWKDFEDIPDDYESVV